MARYTELKGKNENLGLAKLQFGDDEDNLKREEKIHERLINSVNDMHGEKEKVN